jgi:tetratricopeptide (TPR) repeat protein
MPADVDEVHLDDSLELAAQSYRRYLEETEESAMTPEAMRRLADLQIEQEYGVLGGSSQTIEMAAPEAAEQGGQIAAQKRTASAIEPDESELEFEKRATQRQELLAGTTAIDAQELPGNGDPIPAGPREAIETYKKILATYPNYERNDQVLYQMSRAYDEIGQPDEAMAVMNQFVANRDTWTKCTSVEASTISSGRNTSTPKARTAPLSAWARALRITSWRCTSRGGPSTSSFFSKKHCTITWHCSIIDSRSDTTSTRSRKKKKSTASLTRSGLSV